MTNEETQARTESGRGVRFGRAAAWFAAGALGATALTGVAMATTVSADDSNGTQQEQSQGQGAQAEGTRPEGRGGPGGPGGPGGHRGHGGPGGPGGPMVHSEGVVETPDGEFKNVVNQRGQVTEVSDNSITVASEDGYTANYTVDGDTKIHKSRNDASISDVAVGDTVMVMAEKNGNDVVAKRINAMTAEEAAEAEQRRDEMRQRMEENRQNRQDGQNGQDGQTQDSRFGARGGFTQNA